MTLFRCTACKRPLELPAERAELRCRCGRVLSSEDGFLDFVVSPERAAERAHYEDVYDGPAPATPRSIASLADEWTGPGNAINELVLREVGSLSGKRGVLIGNGESAKELFFLTHEPELLVFSDLSTAAVRGVAAAYGLESRDGRVVFAAIDGLDLPFVDGSLDLVYGFAFVHHLPDVDAFLAEAARVLRPGGRAVFMDHAYSPLWQRSKTTWLRPLMRLGHLAKPISPEDRRATLAGGFREPDMARRIEGVGGRPFFHRRSFFLYFWMRGVYRLLPNRFLPLMTQPSVTRALAALDRRLEGWPRMRHNMIELAWGFDKRPV